MSYGMGPTGMAPGQTNTGSMKPFKEKIPTGYSKARIQQYTPEQLQLFEQAFSHVGPDSYLSRLAQGDEALFKEIEAPALRQFSGLQGNIASRFSGGGGGRGALSSRRSSGFQTTMTGAASNFAQELQSQRQALMRQAINDLMGISSTLLDKRPYETQLAEKPLSFGQQLTLATVPELVKKLPGFGGGSGGGGGVPIPTPGGP